MIYFYPYIEKNGIEKRQKEHRLAYQVLEYGLKKEYGISLNEYSLGKKELGKPYLITHPNIYFNISHCEGMIFCGLYDKELGIDIEKIRPFSEKIVSKVLTAQEQEILFSVDNQQEVFFRFWTLKESYIKAIGKGLSFPLHQVEFCWNKQGKVLCNQHNVLFLQKKWQTDYIVSICIRTNNTKEQEEMEEWTWKKAILLP